jgi:TraM recognition site of TraD and TraG
MNLSKGLVGEDNAAILGAMMVTKVQLAAMSRADIPLIEDRRPFYMYVDEFQNFATDSFATILSEARKYGLCLTVANQYISQMEETVRDAVFGNVGSIIAYRISPDDATFMQKYFEPSFLAADIMQIQNRSFIASMIVNGEKAPVFSADTLVMPTSQNDMSGHIINHSREVYTRTLKDVEDTIRRNSETTPALKNSTAAPAATQTPQPGPHHVQAAQILASIHSPASAALQGTGMVIDSSVPATLYTQAGEAPKKKRTRSRRKKPSSPN